MENTPFTGRNVAKYIAKAIVASKTKKVAEDVITDYTQFEEDDIVVDISTTVIGWYVSSKLQPVTDKMVDTTADFVARKRAERASKKDTPSEQ